MFRIPSMWAPIRSDCMAIRLRSRQVNCITGSCPNSYSRRQTGNEPARTTAAVLSVTFTPCTRPTSCLALSRTEEILVPLGGLYSTVTANVPRSRISIRRCGSRLIDPSCQSCCPLGGFHGIFKQHRNGHRADPTGDRADPAGLLVDLVEVYIAA